MKKNEPPVCQTDNPVNQIVIFKTDDGKVSVNAYFDEDTVWLSLDQMADLFNRDKSTISRHIKNIFEDGELQKDSVVANFATTAADDKTYQVDYYNLDVIISVGYRVKSLRGVQFRIWATSILKEYLKKGFAIHDERLKGTGGGNYWKELLDRIRDIRSSEKVLYRQVLDLYSTSIDYDPKSSESIMFFKTVQNKLHYAVNKQTAAETIYSRADAEKEFMGLTSFSGKVPSKSDTKIAKNYLDSDELFRLNRLVSAFFDLAEIKAQEQKKMYMKDWVLELDRFTKLYGKGTLENAGSVSHDKAIKKADDEYRKYQNKNLSPVEKDYLDTILAVEKQITKKGRES